VKPMSMSVPLSVLLCVVLGEPVKPMSMSVPLCVLLCVVLGELCQVDVDECASECVAVCRAR